MIVCCGAIKGGAGKSMIATNLTVIRSMKGKSVLLIDADEQGTSSDWNDHRTDLGITTSWTTVRLKGASVRTEVQKLSKNYDNIIIDCGGRDTASLRAALIVSDVLLIPFQPKSFDIWTAQKVSELVEEAKSINDKLIAYAFINCGGTRGSDNDDAKAILSKFDSFKLLPITVALRKSFSNATAEGLGVVELGTDKKATQEITALHDAVFKTRK